MSRSPFSVKATTLGVSRLPCELIRTLGWSPSMMATTLLVVPRSIPMIFAMLCLLLSEGSVAGPAFARGTTRLHRVLGQRMCQNARGGAVTQVLHRQQVTRRRGNGRRGERNANSTVACQRLPLHVMPSQSPDAATRKIRLA